MDKRTPGNPPIEGESKIHTVKAHPPGDSPGWASGLRQLYDSVVDEPLPDTFNDLLSKLDAKH